MFSLVAKIIKQIALYPRLILGVFTILAILSIYPIEHLRWEIQLQDTLKGIGTQQDYEAIEKNFGGLGSLTIVLQSEDSLANHMLAEKFAKTFENDSLVHFIEWTADFDFFKKNRLLYASENDLAEVLNHIDSVKQKEILTNNPLFVSLDSVPDSVDLSEDISVIQNIEEKYFRNLQQSFSNSNGTIRVIDIYPTHSISIEKDSFLAKALGATEYKVNSFHHQAIKKTPKGFKVVATSADGIVEAVERTGSLSKEYQDGGNIIIGTQFHPEILSTNKSSVFVNIFRTLIAAVK